MKRAVLLTLFSMIAVLLLPQAVFAEVNVRVSSSNDSSSSVNVESHSESTTTICQNGNCTTTGGESKSTVCVNGKCTTTSDNVNYESEDGNTKVQINNNGTNVQVGPTGETTPKPTTTVDPEIEKEIDEAQKEAQAVQDRLKQRVKEQEGFIQEFIRAELENLQKLFNSIFS